MEICKRNGSAPKVNPGDLEKQLFGSKGGGRGGPTRLPESHPSARRLWKAAARGGRRGRETSKRPSKRTRRDPPTQDSKMRLCRRRRRRRHGDVVVVARLVGLLRAQVRQRRPQLGGRRRRHGRPAPGRRPPHEEKNRGPEQGPESTQDGSRIEGRSSHVPEKHPWYPEGTPNGVAERNSQWCSGGTPTGVSQQRPLVFRGRRYFSATPTGTPWLKKCNE